MSLWVRASCWAETCHWLHTRACAFRWSVFCENLWWVFLDKTHKKTQKQLNSPQHLSKSKGTVRLRFHILPCLCLQSFKLHLQLILQEKLNGPQLKRNQWASFDNGMTVVFSCKLYAAWCCFRNCFLVLKNLRLKRPSALQTKVTQNRLNPQTNHQTDSQTLVS